MNSRNVARAVVAMIALLVGVTVAFGAEPTAIELARMDRWASRAFGFRRSHVGGAAPMLSEEAGKLQAPFSLTLDGKPFVPVLDTRDRDWKVSQRDFARRDDRSERTITWEQRSTGLRIICRVWRFTGFPAIEYRLELENAGEGESPMIGAIKSLDLPSPWRHGAALDYARGDDATIESFAPLRTELTEDGQEIELGPDTGRSSDRHLPYFDLNTAGEGLLVGVGWSGSWWGSVRRAGDLVRMEAGMRGAHFRLDSGEGVRLPSILLIYHSKADPQRGHNLLRSLLLAHYTPRQRGELVLPPICATVSTTDTDGSYEGPHLRPLASFKRWGFEAFWSDMDPNHWYPGDFPGGTGNYRTDPKKYPNGLAPIGRAIHANGLEYLLWFEPERAVPGSELYTQHREWLMRGPSSVGSVMVRMQDPAVREAMLGIVGDKIREAGVDWARFDMNIERPASFWSAQDPPDRQGLTEAHYIEGWYSFLDSLAQRYPGLRYDLCSAGGHRLDFESLRRGLSLWPSDFYVNGGNPAAQMLHNGGLARWIPLYGMPLFGRAPSFAYTAGLTAGNLYANFSPEPMMAASAQEQATLTRSIELGKSLRPGFLGDFYELLPHRPGTAWYAYQFHRSDSGSGAIFVFHPLEEAGAVPLLQMKGLQPRRMYNVTLENSGRRFVLSGRDLARFTPDLPEGGSEIIRYWPAQESLKPQ